MRILKSYAARIALLALGFRVLSAFVAFVANVVFPDASDPGYTMFRTASPFWDAFVRHDAGWYCEIARNGYYYTPDGRASIAFFPAYPLLMRFVGRSFGRAASDFYLGGIIVSWLAFVVAMVALWRLASLDLPRRRAERAVLFITIFPFAFFFGMVYTESTYLMFTVLSFYWFRTRRWIPGGLAGALATASRVNGILMLPALVWIVWRTAGPTTRDRILAATGLALVPLGIAAYSLFVYQLTAIPGGSHNPLEWAAAIQRWAYQPGGAPWTASTALIGQLLTHPYAYLSSNPKTLCDAFNGVAGTLFVAALPFVWKRLGAAYGLFVLANLWLPLSSGAFEGVGRYCSVMFPMFIWLATVRSRYASTALIVCFSVLYTFCLALFVNSYPMF